ncbi:MAG: L-2-amino-thiazoline-4-carboxylic acid hydrolase, partial [Deferrisomatales bacterium]
GRVYDALAARLGGGEAVEVIGAAVEAAAAAAGREFAAGAPDGPSLDHFAQVLDLWQEGGALELEEVRRGGASLSFRVTRCAYAELYHKMGLPPALAATLSCRRDAAFARGYHPGLSLVRSPTLAEGAPACEFRFGWGEA